MFKEDVHEIREEVTEFYKDIHRHPEPGFMEVRTSEKIAKKLISWGYKVERIALTGLTATLDSGKPGKTVMLRADMDCLRVQEKTNCEYQSENVGYMHACGHDLHVTMLLYAAKILSQHKEAFEGKIKFLFQPAEEQIDPQAVERVRKAGYEGASGAGFMIQDGALANVDACLIIHNEPSLPVGCVSIAKKDATASSDLFDITIQGRGGHGAKPHEAIDPVPAMCEIVQGIHLIPSREINCSDKVVIHIGDVSTPGSVWNAVADTSRIVGGYRTFDEEIREQIHDRINLIAENIASAHRCKASISWIRGNTPSVNDVSLSAYLAESCKTVSSVNKVIYDAPPQMIAEDGGLYTQKVPGVFYLIGSGCPDYPLHNPCMLPAIDTLFVGIELHVTNAVNILNFINKK